MVTLVFAAGDGSTFIDIVTRGGPIAALLGIILFGGFKKEPWWVFGWVFRDLAARHERLREEKNDWRDMALAGTHIANTLAEREKSRERG